MCIVYTQRGNTDSPKCAFQVCVKTVSDDRHPDATTGWTRTRRDACHLELCENFENCATTVVIVIFNTAYYDDDFKLHDESREIAVNYFKGWFLIDFVSVFPFEYIFTGLGKQTKLFRLARLPRLLKLIDISRFNKMIKSLMNNSSRDERIVAQYMMLYIFKIFRLIIIAMIITYFIGCIWFYFSYNVSKASE